MFKEAQKHCEELDQNFDAVNLEYGQEIGSAAKDIFFSLLTAHTMLLAIDDLLQKVVMIDVATKLTARTCELAQKAYGLTNDQAMEALNIAKDIHEKTLSAARKTVGKE